MWGGEFLIEGDCLIELSQREIGAAKFLLIGSVVRLGRISFLQSGDGFRMSALLKI
jgi:hypothetical protein